MSAIRRTHYQGRRGAGVGSRGPHRQPTAPRRGDFSVARVRLSGTNRRVRKTESDCAYYVLSGSGRFNLGGGWHDVTSGDLIYVPKGTAYQDAGSLDLFVVDVPAFRPEAVEEVPE